MTVLRPSVVHVGALAFAFVALQTSASATIVSAYHPSGMRVTATLRGNCWTQSIAVARTDAYRCMVGNDIYDPCFAEGPRRVACPSDLATNRGIVIVVASLSPNTFSQRTAWAMRLGNGAICEVTTGTGIAGYPFGCTSSLICSAPRRSAGGYVARCADARRHARGSFAVVRIWM
jgi:hypothetical protein